ncbi:sigma-70 family RNA polymerase sigma factor [Aureispira anguillae]|uniref:Sigma-70 family RNA polymerase sigma factor n=1 Tax=Aureispira anguillae TaxID=2864201 RepID=A0A915YC63_9BACT|nr:sigma-70 family RNA polymerase sigma factor [Aureispira anguillae]BDS10333.1 sigma-70 family RNA polymerase sigma factor [Aureispira anguillae]
MTFKINQQLQELLFATAYKMIGEISISQDISQEAIRKYLSMSKPASSIHNPRSYVIKIAIHLSIDYLNKKKKERENYIGTWLPEPIVHQEKAFHHKLDLDYGITVMLSRLSPKERAVFILKESFDYSYQELSETLDLRMDNCRKLYQRLKQKIKTPSNNQTAENEAKKQLIQAFIKASQTGQLDGLINVLKEDIALYSDGGGKISAAKNVLHGIDICSKFLLGIYNKFTERPRIVMTEINNELGFLTYVGEHLISIGLLELDAHKISKIYFIRNPDKIHFV